MLAEMTIVTWLKIVAIGLPLLAALTIWRGGERFHSAQRWLVTITFGLIALIALTLFFLDKQYACILMFGRQNCLFDGLASLSLVLLSLLFARSSVLLRGEDKGSDYILMLLLSSAWAGMGLVENLLVFLIFLNLFFFVFNRWLNRRGLKWRFLVLRDDYKDAPK